MPTLYVTEHYSAVSTIGTTAPAVLPQPALATQVLTTGGASQPSAAFGANTKAVMITTDGAATHFKFGDAIGSTPVATATDMFIGAGAIMIFAVVPGQKIAAV